MYDINLSGSGDNPSSVNDNSTAGNEVFNMKASPNPFTEKVNIEFTIGSAALNYLQMYVIDVNGRENDYTCFTNNRAGNL